MTLRARLAIGLVLVLLTLGVTGAVITVSQRRQLTDRLDGELTSLAAQADLIALRLERSARPGAGGAGPPAGVGGPPTAFSDFYVGRRSQSGDVSALLTPTEDPTLVPDVGDLATQAGPVTQPVLSGDATRVRVVMTPLTDGDALVVAAPMTDIEATHRNLVTAFLVGAVALLAVLALVVGWVIRLGLRPIREMTEAADAIAGGAVDRRIEVLDRRTEAGRLGQALNALVDATQAAESRLRRFVADASHELRTPLTTLQGYSDLNESGGLPDRAAVDDALRRINQEAVRMRRIVDDLLLLSDLDERPATDTDLVDLGPILRDLAEDISVVQPDRDVRVDAPEPLMVVGDRDHLRQAMAAYGTNALRYTGVEAPIDLRGHQVDDTVRIEVADRGPGISEDDQARVFDRFFRADPGRSRDTGGNGLGLAIVASIVAAHDGRYGVDSVLGEGATFWIELPAADPDQVDSNSDQSSGLSSTKALTTSPSTPSTSTRPRFAGGSSAL